MFTTGPHIRIARVRPNSAACFIAVVVSAPALAKQSTSAREDWAPTRKLE
jgi:hypothetical protein